jgi:hypothetical protein
MKIGRRLLASLVLVLGISAAAPAITIQIREQPGPTERNLDQIMTDWGFPVDHDTLQRAASRESLSPGTYVITNYARYSGRTQFFGTYPVSGVIPNRGDQPPVGASEGLRPRRWGDGAVDLTFFAGTEFGFFDDTHRGTILLTSQNQNPGTVPYCQSSGLILDLGTISSLYHGHYIIAFEDGASGAPYGDLDYNDLVVHVNFLPLPGTLPLVAGGLLALWMMGVPWRGLVSSGRHASPKHPGEQQRSARFR